MSAIELIEQQGERTGPRAGGDLLAAARTDKGAVRKDNQDAFLCAVERGLFAVIDGMGGEKGGQRAAALAREALLQEKDPVKGLTLANERVYGESQSDRSLDGMGCVASVVHVSGGVARIAHVGDTRVYMAGSAGCEQLTSDHTLAASIQERLGLSHRGAKDLGGRNQVTRDIGGKPRKGTGWIDCLEVPLEQGAILLLCSDGLYDTIGADDLFARLRDAHREQKAPETLVDELIETALQRGASDNITALVVRQEGDVPLPRNDDGPTAKIEARQRPLALGQRLRLSLIPFLLGLAAGLAASRYLLPT